MRSNKKRENGLLTLSTKKIVIQRERETETETEREREIKRENERERERESLIQFSINDMCLQVQKLIVNSISQRARDVYTTSYKRCIDVNATLYKRHVADGI